MLISCGGGGGGGGNSGGPGTVTGTVRANGSGVALAGVTVSLFDGQTLLGTTTTDASGHYSLNIRAQAGYTLEVDSAGFISATYNSVDVVADQTTTLESILLVGESLTGNGTVSGSIQDALLSPQAGATRGTLAGIVSDSVSGLGGSGATVEVYDGATLIGTAVTGADGRYTVDVDAGAGYTVQVRAAGYAPRTQSDVTVAENATTTLNLQATLLLGTLAGVVSDSVSGLGINGATVYVYNGAALIGTTTTGANGAYTLNVPPGSGYTVQVSAAGYAASTQSSVAVAENATTTLNLQATLILGTLAGVVRDSVSGLGIAGATVEVYNGATLIGTTTTDANGNYTLNVPPGSSYTVQVNVGGYSTLTQTNVTVSGNATTTLNLNPQAELPEGTLEGVVRNFVSGLGIAGATINVYDGVDLIATTTTGASGNYSVSVEAGNDYRVEVSSAGFISAAVNGVDIVADETTILESILQIANTYVGDGTVSGTIKNSLTGSGLAGVTVNLRAGLNTQTGAVVATGTTNGVGLYSIANVPTGYYTAELAKAGFITGFLSVYSLGGQTTGNQNASISPVLAAGETRVVLTWGASPADLDSHFTGPKGSGGRFHILWSARSVNDGSVANLDADDVNSYGPETVTLSTQIAGVYRYSVYNYTNRASLNSTALSNSGAQVRVYQASGLVATYNIPANVGGTLWTVFELNGNTLTTVNTLSYNTNEATIP